MPSANTLTTFDFAIKEHYTPEMVENMVYQNNPLLALIPKYEEMRGEYFVQPVQYADVQSRSASFSTAQSLSTSSALKGIKFNVTRVKNYSLATIDNEAMEASKGNANAFMELATNVIDTAIHTLSRDLAIGLYGNAAGAKGQVLAEPAETAGTFIFTLKDPEQVTNFEVGMSLVIHSAETGGSIRTSDGSDDEWLIAGINRTTGVITLTGTYNASGTIAANDFIFQEGDRGLKMSGLADWLPSSVTSTSFFGVDRTADSTRLGGLRYDGSAQPIEEALIDALYLSGREGARIDHMLMNFKKYAELEKSLGSKVVYDTLQVGQVGFNAIRLAGPRGVVRVVADQNCPSDLAYGLQLDTWKLGSIGKAVSPAANDGNRWLRQTSDDGVELRYRFYGNAICKAPGYNIRVSL
ncbi:MAG: hypothetical protein ACK52I_06420 [Pseudomonadota bacterium]|jgi:hypothetical protein